MKVRSVDDGVIVALDAPEAMLAPDHASWDDPHASFEVQLKFDSDGDTAALAAIIGRALQFLDTLRDDAHDPIDTLGLRDLAPLLAPLRIDSISRHLAPGDDAVHLVTDVSANTQAGAFVHVHIDTSRVPSMRVFMFDPPIHPEEHQASTVVYTLCASRIVSQHRLAALALLMHDLSQSNEAIRSARRTTPRARRRFSL